MAGLMACGLAVAAYGKGQGPRGWPASSLCALGAAVKAPALLGASSTSAGWATGAR